MKPVKILIIDDDEIITDLLFHLFSEEGWHSFTAKRGCEGLDKIEKESPDLVILDMMLPDIDGFEICRRLRRWSQIPIIALSALIDSKDKIECLNLGADDYVTKPFNLNELIARVKGVLRRHRAGVLVPSERPLILTDITIDFQKRTVSRGCNEVPLMPMEYNILAELVSNAENVLTYEELLRKIWGPEFVNDRDYLYVQISHLRDKLENDPKNPQHIISVPRVGYIFQR